MTASEVISRARLRLNDQDEANYRWSDANLLLYLSDGIQEAVTKRPDVQLAAAGTLSTLADVTALTDTISLDDSLRPVLADYVAFLALIEEDPDKKDEERATKFYDSYLQGLYGNQGR